MNLHEYQAKEILSDFGVKIQRGYVATSSEMAVEKAKKLNEETGTEFYVIKAQVHAGGRGKGGGVKLAKSFQEVNEISDKIIGMNRYIFVIFLFCYFVYLNKKLIKNSFIFSAVNIILFDF